MRNNFTLITDLVLTNLLVAMNEAVRTPALVTGDDRRHSGYMAMVVDGMTHKMGLELLGLGVIRKENKTN